ncbi:kinase-like protein [Backusella circina FSU 941]|nr:kinase-like protein [Backusella circina FSU 941]
MGAVCCKQEEIDFASEVELVHFYLLESIGQGAFGKVRIVQHKGDKKRYALKYISKAKCIELNAVNNILTERKILEKVYHPLLVNLRFAFHDSEHLFMVLDLMLGGDLRFHLERLGHFNELQTRFFVANLILALDYLHKRNIVHRDIKPDNILLDSNGHAHLSDFNIATQLTAQKPCRHSRAGSLAYMAPEIIKETAYGKNVDWWSLGITAYELLFGKRPFERSENDDLKTSILYSPLEFPSGINVSSECKDVVNRLLQKTPEERLGSHSIDELKSHPWFRGLDWKLLETKEAISPFIPNRTSSNFDVVHEIEDLLFEEEALRPRKTSSYVPNANTIKDLLKLDDYYLPYDYTKGEKYEDDTVPQVNQESTQSAILPTTILRRVGDALEQTKYKSQGYYELTDVLNNTTKTLKQT